ncbi:MAG: glycosyltransferase family 2 protein [Rhodoferax sp.]|jgi:hypothetical protein|nr:glycosyltransferase family 2 protein [Rhodoferax sp.]MBP9060605.1 glycosyltransferase family 2 protein [Rhodoferax sp.]MBP9685191.1 glycosyltransferase family 2 protein [Rhodoferax sp.]
MISIVVNFFNNCREAERTLFSLSRAYQKGIFDTPYEVIVIDHGSTKPLSASTVMSFGPEFKYRFVKTTSVSPVKAINVACRDAAGDELLVLIDGAHILSPGILKAATDAFKMFANPFIATVPFHLGPKRQNESVADGYNQQVEDALLAPIDWKSNGYKLYTATGNFADSSGGWFGCLLESGCFGMRKADYLTMGGFDERFQTKGGGLVALEFFKRAVSNSAFEYVMLLGEGTFHQFHGGVASNAKLEDHPFEEFHNEYTKITGTEYSQALRKPYFVGQLPNEVLPIVQTSAAMGTNFWLAMAQNTA